ncbi:MAG TPA: hypothetical protein VHK63_06455 [Candidatus Limnocylindria bacterium]|nr:hypothetical protein [Candidatus Limnocylindria bacterium]
MTSDQTSSRTTGETHGQEQEPVEAGERDTTQRDQAHGEGAPATQAPEQPDAQVEDSIRMAHSPDAAYGKQEGQAGTPDAGMPTGGGESQGPGGEYVPQEEDGR